MKKFLSILMAIAMLCGAACAEMQIVTDIAVSEAAVGEAAAVPAAAQEPQQLSLTTGLPRTTPDKTVVVQMDNEPGARPQKGIAGADIIYEVEIYNGGYTRYTAVFNDTIPELVEPIRSTRIVHVDIYKEYGGGFVYYGIQGDEGTHAGQYMAQLDNVFGFSGLSGRSEFYRDSSRKAPNNVILKLPEIFRQVHLSSATITSPLKFSADNYTVQGSRADQFGITYRSGSYCPSYRFQDGQYYRYYNGDPQKDGTTGEHLHYSNVIVQHVDYDWFNGEGDRPVVSLYGKDSCDFFIDGMHFTGYWERNNVNENTRYYDADGNEVIFKPGKTFIQILKKGRELSIAGKTPLKNGSTGEGVKLLQQKLVDMGLLTGKVDGIYGKMTAAAVSAAQAKLGLAQTGEADLAFQEALFAQ